MESDFKKGQPYITIENHIFSKELSFNGAIFAQPISFENCRFERSVEFLGRKFRTCGQIFRLSNFSETV